jgi:hypothetical protein
MTARRWLITGLVLLFTGPAPELAADTVNVYTSARLS